LGDSIAYWTLIATAVSAVASAIALGFNAYELRQTAKSRDADWLFRFIAEIRENERRFLGAAGEPERRHALVDYMNFLNSVAGACKKKLLPTHTMSFVTDYLIQAIAIIRTEGYGAELARMKTSSTTFVELTEFYREHRAGIERVIAEQATLTASSQLGENPVKGEHDQ
jgi:hypothetical protein